MFQLLILLVILIGSYGLLTVLAGLLPKRLRSRSLRGRVSLAIFFVFTGVSHFLIPEQMAQLLPPALPLRVELIYVTGVLEILGAIGLLVPRLERLASVALILFLLAVLPANIYAAFNNVAFGAHDLGPVYLLARIPFQLFVIGWAYYFGIRLLPRTRGTVQERLVGLPTAALK